MRISSVRNSRWIKTACLAAALAVRPAAPARSAPALPPVAPLAPAECLKLLPAAPEHWKLTASRALNQTTDMPAQPGLETIATREYLFIPPPDPSGAKPDPSAPPKTIRLFLIDGGNDPQLFAAFENFKPQAASGTGVSRRFVQDGCPVIESGSKEARNVSIALAPRFVVSLTLRNQEEKDVDQWLRLLNLPTLLGASRAAPGQPLPKHRLSIASVDEMNPQNNNVAEATYLTREEEAAAALQSQKLDAELRKRQAQEKQ